MHLTDTRAAHVGDGWQVEFVSDDGDAVSVHVAGDELAMEDAIGRAKVIMIELTGFGTRGGGRSVNAYDAVSNGNFDHDQPLLGTRH
jgi:hypothetical protein